MTQGSGQIRWTIHLENGEERTGEARFADLPLLARRDRKITASSNAAP